MNSVKSKIILIATFLLFGCGEPNSASTSADQPLKPVRTKIIQLGQQTVKSFPGVVDASQTAELGFRVNGELKEVLVQEGSQVQKDQILAKLDQTDFELAMKSAKSEFERVQSDFRRAEKLVKKGAISRSDFDSLKAQKDVAKVQLETAQQNLKYTVLKAPFDGVIARTYLSNFEKISSSEKFAAIQDLSSLEVSIDIPESIMIKVRRGGRNHDVFAVFEELDGQKFPLTFKEVSTRADENTQTYRVSFAMPYPEETNILPGMSTLVTATEKQGESSNTSVYVPTHAVLEDSAGRFVYTVKKDNEPGQGIVERRSVIIGSLNENGIHIVQGLTLGDHVITAGMSKISNGMKVRLMDEDV